MKGNAIGGAGVAVAPSLSLASTTGRTELNILRATSSHGKENQAGLEDRSDGKREI